MSRDAMQSIDKLSGWVGRSLSRTRILTFYVIFLLLVATSFSLLFATGLASSPPGFISGLRNQKQILRISFVMKILALQAFENHL